MIDNITTNSELIQYYAVRLIRGGLLGAGIFFTWHAIRAYFYVLRWYWRDVLEMWIGKNMDALAGKVTQKVVGRIESRSGRNVPYIVSAYVTLTEARRQCNQWNNRLLRQWWICFKRSMKGQPIA